jgi:hypothetical protein
MRRGTGVRAVLVGLALCAAPLLPAPAAGDRAAGELPTIDITMGDDAVAGLPGVAPAGPAAVRVTNAGSSDRALVVGRLDRGALRVAARTASLAPGGRDVVVVRFAPGRWVAEEAGVSRAPAAVTLVPATAPGAPR